MLLQLFFLCLSFYFYREAPDVMDRSFMFANLLLAGLSISNCFVKKEKIIALKGQYMRHSLIFLVGFCVVFYQYDLDYVFHFIDAEDVQSLIWYDTSFVAPALSLANVGLNSFLLGYLYIKINCVCNNTERIPNVSFCFRKIKIISLIAWMLLFIYIVVVNKKYLMGGYARGINPGEFASHIFIYLQGILIGLMTIISFSNRSNLKNASVKYFIKVFLNPLLLSLCIIVLVLMSGRRTEALRFVLLLGISYLYITRTKLKISKLIMPFVLFSLSLSVVSVLRMNNAGSITEAISYIRETNSISPLTQELAFNCCSLHIALSNVPSLIPYNYGLTIFLDFLLLIPGLQSFVFNYLAIPEVFQSSAFLLTELGLGSVDDWGLGTSILADIYCSLGIGGIVVIMFIIGMLIRKLELITFSSMGSPYMLALSFCFYSGLIFMSRGSLATPMASVTYACLCILFSIKKYKST